MNIKLINNSWVCSAVLFAFLYLVSQQTEAQNKPTFDSVNLTIQQYLAENNVPGIAACVVIRDSLVWSKGYGKANIEQDLVMNIDATMMIASISKTITATAVMQLIEKGLINLDTDINEYLSIKVRNPKFPDIPITIQQLLTHTSSIRDGPAYDASYVCGDPEISLKDWIENYFVEGGESYDPKKNFNKWKPGDEAQYSNVGFGLLGYIVESVAKIPFSQYCQENIFAPLKMDNTAWFNSQVDQTNQITNYELVTKKTIKEPDLKKFAARTVSESDLNINIPLCKYNFSNYPDGAVFTSVRELSYFLRAIINGGSFNGAQILMSSTINSMLTLQIEGNDEQGLCWGRVGFESLWGHSGGDFGIATYMYFNRETNIGVITFQNSSSGRLSDIVKELYTAAKSNKK